MSGPLQGLNIFDLTVAGVGPWASMILANMGANVIKIENAADPRHGGGPNYRGLSVVYMHCHLGKKGIYLDLKPPEGQEVAKRLVKDADVFVENMKLGTADRLALGYEAVSKVNPRIVYGNHPGWGDAGPLKGVASSDIVGQAFSGTAGITGKRGGEAELLRWYALYDFNASPT